MKCINFMLNGKKVMAKEGSTVLEAAKDNGVYIPGLCAHGEESPFACRLCIVEVSGRSDMPASCVLTVEEGMSVWTDTPNLSRKRRRNLAKLLENHPSCCLTCPRVEPCDGTVCQKKPDYEERCATCAKDQRCELQKAARYIKIGETLLQSKPRSGFDTWNSDPFFIRNYNLCIGCGQCVTACKEVLEVEALKLKIGQDGKPVAGARLGGSLKDSGCRFCGVCAEVCPTSAIVQIIEEEEPMKGRPDSLVPCRHTCPAGIDVPNYVKYIADGEFSKAYDVIRAKTPFAGSLAHICPHPCEDECRRHELNDPVSIRMLKRFAVENKQGYAFMDKKAPGTGKRVAIVGAGPAGLTASYHMAKLGHDVTIFEASNKPGGMMWWGIPKSQLPEYVLMPEIEEILALGVDLRLNYTVDNVGSLLSEGFDCVFLALGLQEGKKLRMPGADAEGTLIAVDFLSRVNGGEKVQIGKKVLVLGGGDVAADCAMVARRMGEPEVTMACLECSDTIPAHSWMIEEAQGDGVTIRPSLTFKEITTKDGKVTGVKCQAVKSMRLDETGRMNIEVIPDSECFLEADTVIFAIGQGLKPLQNWSEVKLTPKGTIAISNADTLETDMQGVFAGGDAVSGPASVVKAIGAGRTATQAMDKYLGGTGLINDINDNREEQSFYLGAKEGFCDMKGAVSKLLCPEIRINSFDLVELGMKKEEAMCEALRCLRCDLRLRMIDIIPVKAKKALIE